MTGPTGCAAGRGQEAPPPGRSLQIISGQHGGRDGGFTTRKDQTPPFLSRPERLPPRSARPASPNCRALLAHYRASNLNPAPTVMVLFLDTLTFNLYFHY